MKFHGYSLAIPFLLIHLMPFFAIFTGVTWFSVFLCAVLYAARMFFITAGYHRYFSHRTYKLGRVAQFVMALGGTLAWQKGPLWWAAHHRNHHQFSDTDRDMHSPTKGFWWSHIGWILSEKSKTVSFDNIQDLTKFPELRWLDRHFIFPSVILGAVVFLLWGASALFIGFFLSAVLVSHNTFFINSLAHVFGRRRFATPDASRNNFFLALATFGEGWHNNHHHFMASARQGFFWWELDLTYYVLKALSWINVVRDLHVPPKIVLMKDRIISRAHDIGLLEFKLTKARAALARVKLRAGKVYERRRAQVEYLESELRRMIHSNTQVRAV